MAQIELKDRKGFLYPDEVFDDFGCFMSGELITIVAPSNSGKTTFAMNMLERNAGRGRKGYYINLEFAIETMWEQRWLWANNKKKENLTDLAPLSDEEKEDMKRYINEQLGKFDYYNNPNGLALKDLESEIMFKAAEGYELFVIDTFSRIQGNLDSQTARTSQNKCMEELQALAQQLNVAIVMLHHTNRAGTWEGSQKIMDLSNVFIMIEKDDDMDGTTARVYKLMKDKYIEDKEIRTYFNKGRYILDRPEDEKPF